MLFRRSKNRFFFSNLTNNSQDDYSRYIYFYLTYLIENNKLEEAEIITNDLDYINSTLLLSQEKVGLMEENLKI